MSQAYRVFLSAATTELGRVRGKVAEALRGLYVVVDEQKTFVNSPADTLRMLANKIRQASLVIHIAGKNPGSAAPATSVDDLFNKKNEGHVPLRSFLRRFVGLGKDDLTGITYTQWEALLAVYYDVPMIVYAPASASDGSNGIAESFPQKAHLDRLAKGVVGRKYRPNFYKSLKDFGITVIRDTVAPLLPASVSPPARPKPLFSEFFEPDAFIGRDEELEHVADLVRRHRVVNLVGPGGSGKTWLANKVVSQVQDEFPDGSWVVELAGVENPGEIERAVGLALKIGEKDGKLSLAEYFASREALLVLDNCERLKQGCAEVIRSLAGCAKLRIITTSTIDLGLGHAKTWHVHPLHVPAKGESRMEEVEKADAVKLLLAHADGRGLQLTDQNAAQVAEICRLLEGMPLALKIVAKRCTSSSVRQLDEVVASMEEVMEDAPYSDDHERHKTVTAVVDWSYKLLTTDLQEMMVRLCIFRDGFSAEAAREVCAGPAATGGQVTSTLRQLADHCMIETRDIPPDEDESGRRYRLLEPIRLYCAGKLNADPSAAQKLAEKHRDWCVRFLQGRARIMEDGGNQLAVSKQIFVEHDNIRAAMNWCREHQDFANGLQLAVNIWRFWEVRGFHMDGRREIEALIEANPPGTNERLVARAYTAAGMLAYRQGKFREAGAAFDKALAMEAGFAEPDRLRLCMCRTDVANVLSRTGRLEESLNLHRETLVEAEAIANTRQLAIARFNCAALLLGLGRVDDADEIEDLLKKSEDGFRRAGCLTDVGYPMAHLGWLAFFKGSYEKATKAFLNAYENRVSIGSKAGMLQALEGGIWSLLSHGDIEGGRIRLQECLKLRPALKADTANAEVLECAALFALKAGRAEDALTCLAAAAGRRQVAGNPRSNMYANQLKKWEAEARQQLSEDDADFAFKKGRDADVENLFRNVEAMVKA